MIKIPPLFLSTGAAFIAATVAQQPAYGSNVTHARKLAQAAPQEEIKGNTGNKENKMHVHKRGHEADKNKPPHKPETNKSTATPARQNTGLSKSEQNRP